MSSFSTAKPKKINVIPFDYFSILMILLLLLLFIFKQPLDKVIKKNPKYDHVQSTLDTGYFKIKIIVFFEF